MNFAALILEANMDREKLQSLLLLDLCAFAASLFDPWSHEEAMEEYERAYNLAEKYNLPELHTYKDFMERL
jgi:pyruvate/2-oxoacid:ferredoxin oxidoreductase alpha subunit